MNKVKTKNNWVKAVERRGQSILISSYFYNGIQTKFFKKIFGLNFGLDHYLIVDYSNYYLDSEVKSFQKGIERILEKTEFNYLETALDKLFEKGEELILYSNSLKKIKNHIKAFKKFSELCLAFGPAMYFPILIEKQIEEHARKIISHRVKDKNKHDEYFRMLTACMIPTEGTKELISLYKIAEVYFKKTKNHNKKTEKMINNHLNKYNWLSFTKFVGDPWTKEKIFERIYNHDLRV